ncbi:hypothetical protein MA20_13380 [Bradyrhizobium japonicum]|uniref:Uncharacterized protein n=1 Tax=Bradyrhizobium japonicum TaxID=375 RepID=A0A0A3Z0I1_BRAJP|nr:hypothetical protein MA20_13380 [Bradyrhizobium japonicum]
MDTFVALFAGLKIAVNVVAGDFLTPPGSNISPVQVILSESAARAAFIANKVIAITPSKVALDILFPLSLQPKLHKPPDGFGASGLVFLRRGPIIDGGSEIDGEADSGHRVTACSRAPSSLFW